MLDAFIQFLRNLFAMTRSAVYLDGNTPNTPTSNGKCVGKLPYANRPAEITPGTYTPIHYALGANINSYSFSPAQYLRIGDVVTVSGLITINCVSANTVAQVWATLPFDSIFTFEYQLAGTLVATVDNECGACVADVAEQGVEFYIANPTAADTNLSYVYHYTYRVIP